MHQLGLLFEVCEKFVEFGLDALAHAAEHDSDQRGQGQLTLAHEGVASAGMAGQVAELSGVHELRKRGEQGR